MKKRITTGALWLYVTWYAWSMLASETGLPELVGPFLGIAVAAFVWLDPLHLIWRAVPSLPRAVADPLAAQQHG